jgi:two-component system phosphate regulon sensor histidine kinase PhoR
MIDLKEKTDSFALAALVLSIAECVAYVTGFALGDGSPWVRVGAFGFGLLLALLAGWILVRRERDNRKAAQTYLDALCGLDPRDLQSDVIATKIPPLPRNNPWRPLAARVEETLIHRCGRLQELEHARAALEIRCQRAYDECQRIKAILIGLSNPVIAIDEFDEVALINPAAEEVLGVEHDAAENRAIAQLVHCEQLVDLLVNTCHRRAAAHRSDEIELADAAGQTHWYRASACKLPAMTQDGSHEGTGGAVAVLHNIDQQKTLQKRNAEFVSSVSHEMKTPLAGIKAYVELLADGDAEDEETREEFLAVINGQADRLQRLVDNLLNLARIEAGVVKVNKESRSLNELLEEAANVVRPAAEAKQITLHTELSPLYLGVLADRDMLLQAAINLLSNAIKYTAENGSVTIRSRLDDNEVVFEVADTGVGLSQEDCERVFEKFYRVAKGKSMAPGTGLGLPLAKHIVEDVHGGRLTLESELGVGSTFIASLPNAGQLT